MVLNNCICVTKDATWRLAFTIRHVTSESALCIVFYYVNLKTVQNFMWTTALRNVLMKSSVPAVLWKRMLTLSRNRPSKQLMGQLEELRLLSGINKGKSARIAIVFRAF